MCLLVDRGRPALKASLLCPRFESGRHVPLCLHRTTAAVVRGRVMDGGLCHVPTSTELQKLEWMEEVRVKR